MADDYKPQLLNIFPTNDILVEAEEHEYKAYEASDGSTLEEREYTLDKAPVDSITDVIGTANSGTYTFEEGTDYKLSSDGERIVWLDDPATRPDGNSIFYVDYRCESIISRYLDAGSEEFTSVEGELQQVIKSKFIDQAEGDELDEIGGLFGKLGKRGDRDDDTQYRLYLKSIVQSFVSRGTKTGIKTAVSVVTNVPEEDISISEDFENNEYEIVVVPNTPVRATIIQEIAEVADPSGVKLLPTRFTINIDVVGVNDTLSIDKNKHTIDVDVLGANDTTSVDANKHDLATDGLGGDDTFTGATETSVAWDSGSWNDMNWATEHN